MKSIEFSDDFVQVYDGIEDYVEGINSKWAFKYLLWLFTKTNKENLVRSGAFEYDEFRNALRRKGVKEEDIPVDRTMARVIADLRSSNILIKIRNGVYKLNPLILWKGPSIERKKEINEMRKTHYLGPVRTQEQIEQEQVTETQEENEQTNQNLS